MSLLNQAQPLQRRETVGDYGAAELGLPFDVEARRRDAVADERQDRGQAPAPAFHGGGTTDAPFLRAGRGPCSTLAIAPIATSKPLSPAASRLVFDRIKAAFKCQYRLRHNFPAKVPILLRIFKLTLKCVLCILAPRQKAAAGAESVSVDQVGVRNDRGRSISLSGQLLGPARGQRGGRNVDRTADLSHLRRHGPRHRGNRSAPAIRASSFSTAISWTIRAARKRSPRRFQPRASSWSPPILAPISSSPTSSIRSSAASPASPTPRLSSRRSIW